MFISQSKKQFLVLILAFVSSHVSAAGWTGIHFSLGDETIPVRNATESLTLTPSSISFQVEDKTANGIRIGALMSKKSIELSSDTLNIDGEADAIGLFIRHRFIINEYLSFPALVSIINTTGVEDADGSSIEWLEKSASIGIALKWKKIRVTPSAFVRQISGDYNHSSDGFAFKQQQLNSTKLDIDLFVEPSAFVRFSVTENSENTFTLSFARVF